MFKALKHVCSCTLEFRVAYMEQPHLLCAPLLTSWGLCQASELSVSLSLFGVSSTHSHLIHLILEQLLLFPYCDEIWQHYAI